MKVNNIELTDGGRVVLEIKPAVGGMVKEDILEKLAVIKDVR